MDKMIVAQLNLFSMSSPVYLYEDGKQSLLGTYKSEDLPEALVMLCHSHEVNDIKLSGASVYAYQLMDSIKTQEVKSYSKNSINIEVI